MRNVAEIGLNILLTLLQKFASSSVAGTGFFQTYFCDLMQHIFSVVTDTSHTSSESLIVRENLGRERMFCLWCTQNTYL